MFCFIVLIGRENTTKIETQIIFHYFENRNRIKNMLNFMAIVYIKHL